LVTALAVRVTRELHEAPSVLGLLLAAYGSGTVLGSLLTSRQTPSGRIAPILLGGDFVMGFGIAIMAIRPEIPVLLSAAFASGFAQSLVLVTYVIVRTNHSPDELLGRIGSTA